MQAENLGVSTPVVVVPTWAKRGFGALPRCSLDDVKGELAVARGLRCPMARPLDDLERKLACAQGGHHEAPPLIGASVWSWHQRQSATSWSRSKSDPPCERLTTWWTSSAANRENRLQEE